MQLYIKIQPTFKKALDLRSGSGSLTSRTITVEVEPNDTVENVKANILVQTGIPAELQVIYFAGCDLENDRTLHSYKVGEENVLLMCFQPDVFEVRLTPAFFRHTIRIEAFADDTVHDIKTMVLKEEHVPLQKASLFIGDKELNDECKLCDYGIQEGSTESLVLKLCTKQVGVTGQQIFIEPFKELYAECTCRACRNDMYSAHKKAVYVTKERTRERVTRKDSFQIAVGSNRSVEYLRYLIQQKTGVPNSQQSLIRDGLELNEAQEFYEFCETNVLLQCVKRQPDMMRIIVNFDRQFHTSIKSNVSLQLLVKSDYTLSDIEEMVVRKVGPSGFSTHDYQPSIRGEPTVHGQSPDKVISITIQTLYPRQNKTLNAYNIQEGSELFFNTILRGGAITVFVQSPSGTTSYSVGDKETVKGMKVRIEREQRVTIARQQLAYEGRILDDDSKQLKDYNVDEQSVMQLLFKPDRETYAISVYLPHGRTLHLDVHPNDLVSCCRKAIAQKEKIEIDQFDLCLKNRRLGESETVAKSKIQSGMLLHLLPKMARGKLTLTIRSIDRKDVGTVKASPEDTVMFVKLQIAMNISNMPSPGEQRLQIDGNTLKDSLPLSHYTKQNTTVELCVLMKLYVKAPNGSVIKVKAFLTDKIITLKKYMEAKTGNAHRRQQLLYNQNPLEDEEIIATYNLVENPMIDLRVLDEIDTADSPLVAGATSMLAEANESSEMSVKEDSSDKSIFEALKAKYNLTYGKLSREIDNTDIPLLAEHFDDVSKYFKAFHLTLSDETDMGIIQASEGTQAAMMKALKRWRRYDPASATFGELLKILLENNNKRGAEEISYYMQRRLPSNC